MKQTINDYIQRLPANILKSFLENHNRQIKKHLCSPLDTKVNSFREAINCGLYWSDTEEGNNFWMNIANDDKYNLNYIEEDE